jgi:preprotein translocase subunit SecE
LPTKPWSRRQRVLYGLFLVAGVSAVVLLTRALDAGNRDAAGAIVAVAGVVAIVVFIVWVVRLLLDR